MPKYIKNTPCDIDFLSEEGVLEYLEDELTKLPPVMFSHESIRLLFNCLRNNNRLSEIKKVVEHIIWHNEPFEIQSIAVGLKLFRNN